MKRMNTSFIHSGGKFFCRKMGMHMIGRESNSSHLPDSQVYLYYFLHLWPFNRTPPIWWRCWRFFAHHKLDIKNISSIKGMTSQEAEGWWSLIGDFRHLRYQFFPFFWLSLLVQDCYILFRISPEVLTIFQIPLSPPFKVSNLFLAPPSSKIRSSHLYYSPNLFQSSYSSFLSKPSQ